MTDSPRLERSGPLALSGLVRPHNPSHDTYIVVQEISRQWTEYMTRRVAPPWNPEARRYGVVLRREDGDVAFSYFCGAPPPEPLETPPGFIGIVVPALTFAVFPFYDHITTLRDFVHSVFGRELPRLGLKPAPDGTDVPEFIERYDWRYNPAAGRGGFDLLIPVAD